jgi:hypothetical protein
MLLLVKQTSVKIKYDLQISENKQPTFCPLILNYTFMDMYMKLMDSYRLERQNISMLHWQDFLTGW